MRRIIYLTLGVLSLCVPVHARPVADIVHDLPDGEVWLRHLREDLLPFWLHPAARGEPEGRFPTFRCNDGGAYDAAAPCPELAKAPDWVKDELGRRYVRMQSRQVFAYAVGFHLTGDSALLRLARAGVDDIRRHALDRRTGSVATWFENGEAHPPVGERTAQDLAYAGIALASVYYLERDPAVLDDLDRLHRHLMSYYDVGAGQMRWTLSGPDAGRQELVAQLDPLNAYMVLTTPLLDAKRQARWKKDLRQLATAIRERYCDTGLPRCWGTLGDAKSREPGQRHNDFGHSGKAFWMTKLAARLLGDAELERWADRQSAALLSEAYVAESGSWASRWRSEGVEKSKSWWIYAELDQLASTLALSDAGYAQYLQRTWAWWLKHFVDPVGREVYGGLNAEGKASTGSLKQHHWKNGYHSTEHALIGYLAAQALHGRPATLYYALTPKTRARLQPYFFAGREIERRAVPGPEPILQVRFRLEGPKAGETAVELPPAVEADARAAEPAAPADATVALTAERLPELVGQWSGEWRVADGDAGGKLSLRIEELGERLVGEYSVYDTPYGDKTIGMRLNQPVALREGKLWWSSIAGKPQSVPVSLSATPEHWLLQWSDSDDVELRFLLRKHK